MLKIHSFLQRVKDKKEVYAIILYSIAAIACVFYYSNSEKIQSMIHITEVKQVEAAQPVETNHIELPEETAISQPVTYDDVKYTLDQLFSQLQSKAGDFYKSHAYLFEPTQDTKEEECLTLLSMEETPEKPQGIEAVHNPRMKVSLSDDDKEILYRIVEAEATGEDIYGKILVANVILNRVNAKRFPNNISDVVFQKNGSCVQFAPIKDGRYYSVKITQSSKEAVERALSGEDYSNGALFFFARALTTEKKAEWFDTSLQKVLQYGCHEFYKYK